MLWISQRRNLLSYKGGLGSVSGVLRLFFYVLFSMLGKKKIFEQIQKSYGFKKWDFAFLLTGYLNFFFQLWEVSPISEMETAQEITFAGLDVTVSAFGAIHNPWWVTSQVLVWAGYIPYCGREQRFQEAIRQVTWNGLRWDVASQEGY